MGEIMKTYHPRRYPDGKEAHEKMFNIIGLSGNAHKTTMRDAISCPVMAEIQNAFSTN